MHSIRPVISVDLLNSFLPEVWYSLVLGTGKRHRKEKTICQYSQISSGTSNVWECCTEDESLARELERKYHISSKQYTEEGIRLRLLGENMPSESGCIACDVTLEDAYIYVTNR